MGVQDALGTLNYRKLSMDDLIYLCRYRGLPARGLCNRIQRKIRIGYLKLWGWSKADFKYETYVRCLQYLSAFPYGDNGEKQLP